MVNFPAIFIANGTAILLLLIIIFSSKKSIRHGLLGEKMFFGMVFINIIQCIIEVVTFLMDGKMEYRTFSLVLNAILFSNSTLLVYFSIIYSDFKLFADIKRIKRIYPFMAIPSILTIIGCLINIFTPVFYEIDQYNVYHRTNLNIIPYVVTYFYMAYAVILIYMHRGKTQKRLFLPVSMFIAPIVLGSLLQFLFYGYSLVWLGASVGLISLYVNLQNESSYVDQLSGLFNRQYLNNLLLVLGDKKETSGLTAGIMLDINNFKSINDRFGHSVGDDAISKVGKMLHTAVGDKGVTCRYGGDEFIILMNVKSHKEIIDMIDNINKKAALFNESENTPYAINFSIGCGTYNNKRESIDDFLKKIDDSMYEDKKRKVYEGIMPDRRCID